MLIKHWSFPLGDDDPSKKDEVTVDIYMNFVITVVTNILMMTIWEFTLDQSILSQRYKAEMKLNNERLDFRTIKIKKKKETFNLKGEGTLDNKQKVLITATINYLLNTRYMEKVFKCGIEVEKL